MPEKKIGKYLILERIGRGGMGTIFKAHDPTLDRSVAVKVISTEVEVTDELRARFFREARACAGLSHPNIVTIYEMGEDDGQLFIVMELLDGEELRRVISQRRTLALEDKLSIMGQVCDGLHYAHQKGIVHRDIKPGNILVQRNGQAKILDFGIAQIATTEGGLTRTGLIMGTLRYISPEQVRGRADARSDMFSVGAVFYELLSLRPPFTGEDPMQLLEQLRTEEPPFLSQVDPTIPPELAAIVERAMRKEPGERFADLEQMRSELEQVQRGLTEEAQRVRARVRGQRDRLVQLQAALAERVGPLLEHEAIPVIDERGRLVTMQELERNLADRIETHQMKIARADALAEAFQRGSELLQAGDFGAAVMEFEGIVAEMPEYVRARESLDQARAQTQAQRRRQLAAQLVQDARTALDGGAYALCLELLKQAAEIPPPAEAAEEIALLRDTAEAALAGAEASRRARQRAERAREQMAQARLTAQAQTASPYAPALWTDAEAKSDEAQAAFAREAYAEAGAAFEAAAAAYGRFEAAVQEAQRRERDAAERAGEQMAQSQQRAQGVEAPLYARELWEAAEGKSAEAQTAFTGKSFGRALDVFTEATALYRQAEQAAGVARQRERRRAEEARDRAAGERSAAGAEAERHAPALWREASAKSVDAEGAFAREQYAKAAEAFDGARVLYREADHQTREARRQREQAEQRRQNLAECRRSALAAGADVHAPADWNEAEASSASGESAFTRASYDEAYQAFDESAALYRRAEGRAREGIRVREVARAEAEKGREAAGLARRMAAAAHAEKYAAESWRAGESAEAQASAALSREEYAVARGFFTEARRQYATAAQSADIAAEAETRRVDAMMGDARRLLESGEIAAGLRRLNEVLALRPGHAAAEGLRRQAEAAAAPRVVAPTAEDVTADRGQEPGALEQTIVQEKTAAEFAAPPSELIDAPTVLADRTVLAEAPTILTEAPPVRAEPTGALADSTVLAGSTTVPPAAPAAIPTVPVASEPADTIRLIGAVEGDATLPGATTYGDATRLSSAPPRVGDTGSTRVLKRTQALPKSSAGSLWRFKVPAAVIALGGVATFVAVMLHSSSQPPPPRPRPEAPAPLVAPPVSPAPVVSPQKSPTGLDAAMELQKRVMDAREDAARTGAESLASAPFAAAAARAREGDAALAQQDMTGAQQRYREALEGYGQAKADATGIAARQKTAAQTAEGQAAAARRAAEVAEAPKLAQVLWAKADTTQRNADDAFKRQTFDRAQSLFGDAEKAYREAERVASNNASLKRDLGLAEQAREVAGRAKQDAEQTAASNLAPKTFASAQQKENEAVGLFTRQEFASARLRFQEAQQAYKQAAQEAHLVAVQRQQSEAEQARDRTARARTEAEQASAPRYAPKPLALAQGKDREATAALGRSEYGLAIRLFRESQSDYQAAALEAKRESAEGDQRQVIAAQKSSAERSRTAMLTRREEAVSAEADRLAKETFSSAQAKQADADGLMSRQNFAVATQAYQDAADRYRDAALRAHGVNEAKSQAESARTRMLAEKQQANQASPQFVSALGEERQGNALYEGLSYKDATEKFRSAEALYAKAGVKAPPTSPPPPAPSTPAPPPPRQGQPPRRPVPPPF